MNLKEKKGRARGEIGEEDGSRQERNNEEPSESHYFLQSSAVKRSQAQISSVS